MEKVYNNGLMDRNTKGIGCKTNLREKENLLMQMGIYMKENGKMIKLMDKELISTLMVPSILGK